MSTHWGQLARSIAAILWPSFIVASIATLLFFALVDPYLLLHSFTHPYDLSSTSIYSIGFFFFWWIAIAASSLTIWLIRTERRKQDFPELDQE